MHVCWFALYVFFFILFSYSESSFVEDEEEKSSNRSRHMVKNTKDEEQQKQHQTNSTISSSSSSSETSKYFESSTLQKNLSKKSTKYEEEQMYYTPSFKTNDGSNNIKVSTMNTLPSNIDDGIIRKKQKEKGNLPKEQENWVKKNEKNDEQIVCTIITKDGKEDKDKEIKSLYFMRQNVDHNCNDMKKDDNSKKNIDTNHNFSPFTTTPTFTHINAEHVQEKNNDLSKEKNTTTSLLTMNQRQNYIPQLRTPRVNETTKISSTASNITTTNTINNNNDDTKRDEQYLEAMPNGDERAAITTANVDDRGENHGDREKGEREKSEDNAERTLTSTTATTREQEKTEEEERAKQPNKNTDSVTSFTSEQHSCPSVVRLSVDDSMANRVSSSSNNKNNINYQNTSSSNNRSSRSTFTTHTYASTNTFNTEPTYTNTPTTGDPRTLHSYYITSSNYRPPRPSPATSLTRHYREYEPSYPSITRYRTPSSSSPFRKTHYLDDSDEEIINEEILEITDLNHYPTLIERWGDDTKTVVRQEGEFKIEDFVEFEETEPTIIEEILYELIYSGDKLKSCRQLDRSRSESRNFRKIKKRRTRRKRQPNEDSTYLTSQATSRDTSGTRSPFYNDYLYSPERSSTPLQSTLSTPRQSTGFLSKDKSSLDFSVRNRFDDQNYINNIRVNVTDPLLSHTQIQQYPQNRITNDIQYKTLPTDSIDKRATDLLDEMRHLSNQIDTLVTPDNNNTLNGTEEYTPVIRNEQGITKINFTPTIDDYKTESLLPKIQTNTTKDTDEIISSDRNYRLLTSNRTTDDEEQSRTNIIDQTSVQKEISRKLLFFFFCHHNKRSNNINIY